MNKEIKVNKSVNEIINEIINEINNAVSELGKIKDITVRTSDSVIFLKETSSLAGYIFNNYEKFKSATLSNKSDTNAVVITKL